MELFPESTYGDWMAKESRWAAERDRLRDLFVRSAKCGRITRPAKASWPRSTATECTGCGAAITSAPGCSDETREARQGWIRSAVRPPIWGPRSQDENEGKTLLPSAPPRAPRRCQHSPWEKSCRKAATAS